MKLSTWVYPWDIAALGVDRTLGEMRDLGLHSLALTANYHPISAFSPRVHGGSVFNLQTGGVLMPARAERYGRIKPSLVGTDVIRDIWPQVSKSLHRYQLEMESWTIGLFQPWIAQTHDGCSRVMPGGSPVASGMCLSSPDVQDWLCALSADIADQFPVTAIELEGLSAPQFDHGLVRPRILTPVSNRARSLLSLCFCDNCNRLAESRGINVSSLRKHVCAEIDICLDRSNPARSTSMDYQAEIDAFVAIRDDVFTEAIGAIKSAIRNVSPACGLHIWAPEEGYESRPIPMDRVAELIDGMIYFEILKHGENAKAASVAAAKSNGRIQLTHLVHCSQHFGPDQPEFLEELEAALRLESSRFGFYNYGLLTFAQMRRMTDLLSQLRSLTPP